MALVNDHVTDASEKKQGGQDAGSAAVARSTGSAHGHAKGGDLQFITRNNQLDSEFQLPVTADAKATWVSIFATAVRRHKCILEYLVTYTLRRNTEDTIGAGAACICFKIVQLYICFMRRSGNDAD